MIYREDLDRVEKAVAKVEKLADGAARLALQTSHQVGLSNSRYVPARRPQVRCPPCGRLGGAMLHSLRISAPKNAQCPGDLKLGPGSLVIYFCYECQLQWIPPSRPLCRSSIASQPGGCVALRSGQKATKCGLLSYFSVTLNWPIAAGTCCCLLPLLLASGKLTPWEFILPVIYAIRSSPWTP